MSGPKNVRRISSDPYAGEVMNIQKEDDGTYYVEIPELEWNEYDLPDAVTAAKKGLERARKAVAESSGESRDELHSRIKNAKAVIEEYQQTIAFTEKAVKEAETYISSLKAIIRDAPGISHGLRELPEDELRVLRGAELLESFQYAQSVAFRLYKDVDRDGDMDHAFVLGSKHKKLVENVHNEMGAI